MSKTNWHKIQRKLEGRCHMCGGDLPKHKGVCPVEGEELIKRLKKNRKRPLLSQKNISETVKKIYYDRKKIYNEADYRIKCNSLSLNKIVDKILNLYEKSGN